VEPNYQFFLKATLTEKPLIFLAFTCTFLVVFFGLTIQIFEVGIFSKSAKNGDVDPF
jgi:hypothetical protein